jgi:hypothetical protein
MEDDKNALEASRRNKLKEGKPYAYAKIMKYTKKARGESTALIDYVCNMQCTA